MSAGGLEWVIAPSVRAMTADAFFRPELEKELDRMQQIVLSAASAPLILCTNPSHAETGLESALKNLRLHHYLEPVQIT